MYQQLKQIGLKDSEIKIYLYLLEHGAALPPQIAKGTGIVRNNLYSLLRSLTDKKLIQSQQHKKRKVYMAQDPVSLLHRLEFQKMVIGNLIPDLKALQNLHKNKPQIFFYNGFEEMKQIWIDSTEAKEIRGFTSTTNLYANDKKFFDQYHKKLKDKNILLRDILTNDSRGESTEWTIAVMGDLYQTRFLPQKYRSIPTDILIWNNKVALMNINQPHFGTVIANKALADTVKIMFDLAWMQLSI
jgi:sugar-specific transcriptional regulator TrmB